MASTQDSMASMALWRIGCGRWNSGNMSRPFSTFSVTSMQNFTLVILWLPFRESCFNCLLVLHSNSDEQQWTFLAFATGNYTDNIFTQEYYENHSDDLSSISLFFTCYPSGCCWMAMVDDRAKLVKWTWRNTKCCSNSASQTGSLENMEKWHLWVRTFPQRSVWGIGIL